MVTWVHQIDDGGVHGLVHPDSGAVVARDVEEYGLAIGVWSVIRHVKGGEAVVKSHAQTYC